MTATERTQWLAERKLGVGGSDVASVFNVGWGCRRRLFFDKRDVPQDFPFDGNKLTRLGTILEPLFADMYAEDTGRKVVERTSGPVVVAHLPDLRVNVDRLVWKDPATMGILEIKSQGRSVFYNSKRMGLSEDYVLQLQAGMLAAGTQWGAFVIGNRDNGELMHWDVDRSEALCKEIEIEVPRFMAQVANGPMPDALEPSDKRCQSCPWRTTCHGAALVVEKTSDFVPMNYLRALAIEWTERHALKKEADDLFDESDAELKARIGEHGAVDTGAGKFTFYSSPRKGYEVKATTARTLRLVKGKK